MTPPTPPSPPPSIAAGQIWQKLSWGFFTRLTNVVVFLLFCVYYYTQMRIGPEGIIANRLQLQKRQLLANLKLPPDGLPGSLALTHRRCGKSTCHCADRTGHPVWSLTFMVNGKKRVERIPEEWIELVRERVEAGRKFKEAVNEIFAANAQLLALWRKEQLR